MWEYRLVWTSGPPSWWQEAWSHGLEVLGKRGRVPETRPDTYLVLSHRLDAGLKLRGRADGDVELKVRHRRLGGWELWEKGAFFEWNDLEAARLAVMLDLGLVAVDVNGNTEPGVGVRQFLRNVGLNGVEMTVDKTRVQATAGELLSTIPECAAAPTWLAELAEIRLPDREAALHSICLEAMTPFGGKIEPLPSESGVVCGYPALLARYTASRL